MDNTMDKYLGTYLDDRYEIVEVIGAGGMAVVYKAMCHRLNRYVAIKILRDDLVSDEELRHRFQTEAQAVAMLSHPNIVSVYDVSHSGDTEYIVMELIDGITLKQYMKKKGALGWKEALHFAVQISKALEHAHERGIIHRDIKPQNLMILKDGTIKVADFGIAALESAQEKKSQLTVGSVHYIAPEQAKGDTPDTRSDIYSLGIVMYEMLTGSLPYEGDSPEEIALKHIAGFATAPTEINGEIPGELARITSKAMSSNINERYQSASELLYDLEEFRKIQANLIKKANNGKLSDKDIEDEDSYLINTVISPDVMPIGTTGEMPKEKYMLRRRRARKVSIMSGALGVLVFIIAVFVFLWNFWLSDIFSVAERIEIPDFMGENYEYIINNSDYKKVFNFEVTFDVNPEVNEGIIVNQDPEPDRSMMIVPEKINIKLTVSAGIKMTSIPDVVNWQYQEATIELQNAGFLVESVVETSDTVTEDYVIMTSPVSGEQLPAGSTVYITVSAGPTLKTVVMPNLIGQTEATAISLIESSNLSYANTNYIESDYDAGIVIKQSVDAYEDVEEHTKIYIWVSTGPAQTPTPSPPDSGSEGG